MAGALEQDDRLERVGVERTGSGRGLDRRAEGGRPPGRGEHAARALGVERVAEPGGRGLRERALPGRGVGERVEGAADAAAGREQPPGTAAGEPDQQGGCYQFAGANQIANRLPEHVEITHSL